MVDIWPNTEFSWTLETFQEPIQEFFLAILVTIGLVFVLTRILPKTSLWDGLILSSAVGGNVPRNTEPKGNEINAMLGAAGKSVSELYPTGQVEIDGIRYEARTNLGKVEKGSSIEVTGSTDYGLIVKKV
ncbi:MAG: NfeD family protein [Opitutae bacterium]|nr:NfeD family protein [Opitutae bacterium]